MYQNLSKRIQKLVVNLKNKSFLKELEDSDYLKTHYDITKNYASYSFLATINIPTISYLKSITQSDIIPKNVIYFRTIDEVIQYSIQNNLSDNYVNLTGCDIKEIPEDFNITCDTLDLSYNNITNIPEKWKPKCNKLILTGNVFNNFVISSNWKPLCKELYLVCCGIKCINEKWLPELDILDLTGNDIKSINHLWLPKCRILYLSFNKIDSFSDVWKPICEKLYMMFNLITNTDSRNHQLLKLQPICNELDLSCNYICNILTKWNITCKKVCLCRNCINKIPGKSIVNCNILDLSCNDIRKINKNCILEYDTLCLAYNKINKIDYELKIKCSNLDLSYNKIRFISNLWNFSGKTLNLIGNEFDIYFRIMIDKCDCSSLQSFDCEYVQFSNIKNDLHNEQGIVKIDGVCKVGTKYHSIYSYQVIKKY